MKLPAFTKITAAVFVAGFCGCQPPVVEEPEATPSPTPTPELAQMESAPVDEQMGSLDESAGPIEAPDTVNLDPADLENQRVKEEVLKRIDVMPTLSAADKDRLYVQVDRARAMGKVITIPFPTGASRIPAGVVGELGESLEQPQIKALTADPTVVFVVLGYADSRGDAGKNLEISTRRAESVLTTIRDRFKILNLMHAVGMGSSEMFDAENFDKNRVVEVWAVLP